jgi:crotonobetainyl-CoA:carnitine CoA-transferase CaiB-like acyl-CoA transferase
MRFSSTTIHHELPPPTLGQHTDAVLKDLGLSNLEIAELRAGGAI